MDNYNDKEFENAKRRIKAIFYGKLEHQQANPYAAVLGGQPGAGKTTLHELIKEQCGSEVGIINGDDYRQYHPRFKPLQAKYGVDSVKYTQKFAGEMTEAIIEELSNRKCNIVIEGTLRTTDIPLKTCDLLKNKGYKADLFIMAVKPEISYQGTVTRYEEVTRSGKIARATPKEHHDGVVQAIPKNLSDIYKSNKFNNILIYNRAKECLYDQSKMPGKDPGDKIKELFSNWNDKDINDLYEIINRNLRMKKERNAEDYIEYTEKVIQIPVYMDKRLVDIKHDVIKSGFKPTKALITNLESINNHFGKVHKVCEIKEMYKNKSEFTKDEQDMILGTVDEFKKQERQMRQEESLEPEMFKRQ